MPPVQCPSCGRFLKNAFVASLATEVAPCPGCAIELRPELFADGGATDPSGNPGTDSDRSSSETAGGDGSSDDAAAGDGAAGGAAASEDVTSVRPPDLSPDEVRDAREAILRGWDTAPGTGIGQPPEDRPPFPTDAAVVAGVGLAGLALGAALGRERRASAAAGGAVAGLVAAAVVRRIWRLDM